MPSSRFDPERRQRQLQRLRQIPVRRLVPNVITLLALCAGLTGIRLAFEERYELALGAIVFAAMLDAVDGRVARMIRGTSRFGAELDSLADFVNFGVAPGLILYHWALHPLGNLGWIAAMVFAICSGLRLARFPLGWWSYRRYQQADAALAAAPAAGSDKPTRAQPSRETEDERPARLN